MSDRADTTPRSSIWLSYFVRLAPILLALVALLVFINLVIRPQTGIRMARESSWLQQTRGIALALYSYANDNHGNYPDGKNSTEVFQKLLDGNYISDSAYFYIPLSGKIKPLPGKKLKAENVSFDVTSGLSLSSSEELPVVFMTGYKVTYAPGGEAVPLIKPYPRFEPKSRTWTEWWNHEPKLYGGPAIGVMYLSNRGALRPLVERTEGSGGFIPNFISPDYKPDGKTYRQLTPDGVLPGN